MTLATRTSYPNVYNKYSESLSYLGATVVTARLFGGLEYPCSRGFFLVSFLACTKSFASSRLREIIETRTTSYMLNDLHYHAF